MIVNPLSVFGADGVAPTEFVITVKVRKWPAFFAGLLYLIGDAVLSRAVIVKPHHLAQEKQHEA